MWERLRDSLCDDDVLIANLRLTDEKKDHEADLVVLMPDIGIVVVEVKGGSVWWDDGWRIMRRGREAVIHPVDQARDGKYALRAYVEADQRWGSRTRVAWSHAVVTPYSEFAQDFALPDLPRWALHDKGDQEHLVGRLRQNAQRMTHGQRVATLDDVDEIAEILTGRLPTTYDVRAEADERADVADRLTLEQATILKVTRLLNRVEVRGGAGSGKTVLALQQAKELTRGGQDRKPQRVALLCYSIGLAEHLRRQVATWDRRHRPAFVGTFHAFGQQWGAAEGDRTDSEFWEERLPAEMAELAADLPDGKKYDAVVVDEAQDFADSWWTPVLSVAARRGGGWAVRLLRREPADLRPVRPAAGRAGPPRARPQPAQHQADPRVLRPARPEPDVLPRRGRAERPVHRRGRRTIPSTSPTTRSTACSRHGWDPCHVALLTTGHRHPIQVERTDFHDQDGYWRTYWDDDVFYGHVLGCKGLERRAVVLCLNEDGSRDRARERLYVGMSRATDELVVVGNPETVRRVAGDDVARRLGIG